MTLNDFASLPVEGQLHIISANGTAVAFRDNGHHNIWLYQLWSFYAEVFFRKEDNSVWKVGGFDHPVLLQPYLDQIDISGVLN